MQKYVNKLTAGAWIVVFAALAVLLPLIGSMTLPELSLSGAVKALVILGATCGLCLGLGVLALVRQSR